jgi:hypothetical protein
MKKPWYLGNTTVRSPFRLREGLITLQGSPLLGNLSGREKEHAFAMLLHKAGVVSVSRLEISSSSQDASDLGRKWRAALAQLGFIVHERAEEIDPKWEKLKNTITTNGFRLIQAETIAAMQECFLRALAAYYIPSYIERGYKFSIFSPLRHVLRIMLSLETTFRDNLLYQKELGTIVQLSSSDDALGTIIEQVYDYRKKREKAVNKKAFDGKYFEETAKGTNVKAETLKDYADSNFRYLKATGLVQTKGKGIVFVPSKHLFIQQLVDKEDIPETDVDYFNNLFNGAALPTDNLEEARAVLKDLQEQTRGIGIVIDISDVDMTDIGSLNEARYRIEDKLFANSEEAYAREQFSLWKDIAAYMDALILKKKNFILPSTGERTSIPKEELPAYFEWTIWRAFLAINKLSNKPYEARSFKVDQDFLPVNNAPANVADIVFEFDDYVLVVEVTLTESSRQEACEGEPVRRHIAKYIEEYEQKGKDVYGLFLANRIDSNTAETFRIGIWYRQGDSKLTLNILPLTLTDFHKLFVSCFETGKIDHKHIKTLIRECLYNKTRYEAPEWKSDIQKKVDSYIDTVIRN